MIKFRTTFQLTNKVESNGFNDRQIALRITNSKAKIHETYAQNAFCVFYKPIIIKNLTTVKCSEVNEVFFKSLSLIICL